MRFTRPTVASAAALFLCATVSAQNEYIANGDFEAGSLAGWGSSEVGGFGNWVLNDGTQVFGGGSGTYAPQNGAFDLTSGTIGPGIVQAFQCFVVPNTVNAAVVSWTDEIRNYAARFVDPTQEFRVVITDLSGVQIGPEIFSTNVGDPRIQGSTTRSFDITARLQALAGQSVCLRFVEEDSLFFFEVSIDDVSLLITSPDPVQTIPLGPGIATPSGPACVPQPGPNSSTLFTPDGAGGYDTTPNGGVIDPNWTTGTPLGLTDDSTIVLPLGFSFAMPGGTVVTDIEVDSNGRAFESGRGEISDFTPTIPEFLGEATSVIAPFWDDFNPSAGGQVWQSIGPGGEFVVTWDAVPQFGTSNANTFQMVLAADDSITLNYIRMDAATGIIGVSGGNGVADPGASDLSAGPVMSAGGSAIYEVFSGDNDLGTLQVLPSLINQTLPVIGTPFDLAIVDNIGSTGDFYLIGNPSVFDLSSIGVPCSLLTDGALATVSTAPGAGYTLNVPNRSGLVGRTFSTQGVILDPAAGNPFFVLFTNSIDFTIGDS